MRDRTKSCRVILKRRSPRGKWQRTTWPSEVGEAILEMCDKLKIDDRVIDTLQNAGAGVLVGAEGWYIEYETVGRRKKK